MFSPSLHHDSGSFRRSARGRKRLVGLVLVAAVAVAACSGSDASESSVADSTTTTTVDPDFFDTSTEQDEPDSGAGDFEVEIDENTVIATEDGQIPTTVAEEEAEESDGPEGQDTPPEAPAPEGEEPAPVQTIAAPDAAQISRIVSLSATHTETLFALGLGDLVVAVDGDSDFPAEAEALQNSFSFDSGDVGAILALEPDVVITGVESGALVERLSGEGIAVYNGPPAKSVADVYTQIVDVATLVGRADLGEDLVARMQADIAGIVASLPATDGLTFFHEIDPSLFSTPSNSFLSDVYGQLGLTNIAAESTNGGAAQMASDAVVAADPDVIVLADVECCDVNIDRVAARPGWATISAVESGAVVPVTEALANRWGPRVVDLIRAVAGGVAVASS